MLLKEITTIVEAITVYHGSDAEFDKFDTDKIGTASGFDEGGWGFYFSDSESVPRDYISGVGNIKKFEIPNGDYLDLDNVGDEGFFHEVYEELEEQEIDENELEGFRSDFMDDPTYVIDTSNKMVYDWVAHVMGSRRAASEFFDGMGYVGTKFSDKNDSSATNYVIFSPSNIRPFRGD